MSVTYHYGVPGVVIWSVHILMGLFFIYVGWQISRSKSTDQKSQYTTSLPPWIGFIILTLGILALFYHLHLLVFGGSDMSLCPVSK